MMAYHIDILCIQETRRKLSCIQELNNDFLMILSESDGPDDIFSGVGFIIAPHCRRDIITYRQQNERMCMVKLKIKGGKMVLFWTYTLMQTPTYSIDIRQSYFEELSHFYASVSCNGPKIISGDLNSRLYMRFPAEEDIVGPDIVEQPDRHFGMDLNRFLLLELCAEL